jgi:hypothetical protein
MGTLSVIGTEGCEEDMSPERGNDFRKELEGYLRGRVKAATYNLERKTLANGTTKVYAELHLEVE